MKFEVLKIEEIIHEEPTLRARLSPRGYRRAIDKAGNEYDPFDTSIPENLELQQVRYTVDTKATTDDGKTLLTTFLLQDREHKYTGYDLEIIGEINKEEGEEEWALLEAVTGEQWIGITERVEAEAEKLSAVLLEKLREEFKNEGISFRVYDQRFFGRGSVIIKNWQMIEDFKITVQSRKDISGFYKKAECLIDKYEKDLFLNSRLEMKKHDEFKKEAAELIASNSNLRTSKYRIDTATRTAYKWSEEHDAYLFLGTKSALGTPEWVRIKKLDAEGCYID